MSISHEFNTNIEPEISQERTSLETDLELYLSNFYGRLSPDFADTKGFLTEVERGSLKIIYRNNEVATTLKMPEYGLLVEKGKKQKGECSVNVNICIDGRIPTIHLLGRVGNTWETGAGIVEVRKSELDGQMELESARLTEAVIERTEKPSPQMLQIMLAHTSLSEHRYLAKTNFQSLPKHGCGRMAQLFREGNFQVKDLVEQNLKIHGERAEAFTNLYNRAAKATGKEQLKQVAITGVYDTDTMGLLFGYGTDHELFTTDITKRLLESEIDLQIQEIAGPAASMTDTFTKAEYLFELESKICATIDVLMANQEFSGELKEYISAYYPDLTTEQQQALFYTVLRNVATQRTTGTYFQNPFTHHGEGYQSISLDGVIVGEFDPGEQVFGATVSSPEEAKVHIQIQSALMDSINATTPPYYLFISKAISNGGSPDSLERSRGALRTLFREIKSDPSIIEMIRAGRLVPVPVLIDSKTREIRHIAKEMAI